MKKPRYILFMSLLRFKWIDTVVCADFRRVAVELPYAPIQSGCISCQVDVRLLPCNLQWLTLHQC